MPLKTYLNTGLLLEKIIRVSKSESAMVYFILEGHEGLAMISTLDDSLNEKYRDLKLTIPVEFENQVEHLMLSLKRECAIEILYEKVTCEK